VSAYLDERYFDWLYSQVCSVEVDPFFSYRGLLNIMYVKPYMWMVPNDDNREEDGKDLRFEFLEEEGIQPNARDTHWLELQCSVLEFLVALARLFAFEADGSVEQRFMELLENLGLDQYNDEAEIDQEEIEAILDRLIWRRYEFNGGGGLFPLRYPERDQRWVEVWYQLNAYVLEHL
jgi:hypothetical protein